MANRFAGQADVTLGGEIFALKITLGAIAEVEDQLGLNNMQEFADLFTSGNVKTGSVMVILTEALIGGGLSRNSAREKVEAVAPHELTKVFEGLSVAFMAAFASPEERGAAANKEGKDSPPAGKANL